jgi:hypothetical protein
MHTWESRTLRWSVAFVWLVTGLEVFVPFYREVGARDLARLHLPEWIMFATCAGEVLLGLRVALGNAATWLSLLQSLLILGFTAILASLDPLLLAHPYGILSKNLPLLAVIWTAWLLEREGWSPRARWLLRGGAASIWITEGIFPKIVFPGELEWDVVQRSGLVYGNPARFLRILGALEALSGVGALLLRGRWLQFVLLCQIVGLMVLPILVSLHDWTLWVHPYGPLTKNVPILAGTLVVLWRESVHRE